MKRLFYSFLTIAFLLGGGVAFAYVDDGNANIKESVNGTVADPLRVYMLVRYAEIGSNAVGLSTGDVVVWDTVSDDGVSVGLVTTVSSTDSVAGVVVGNNSNTYSGISIPTADQTGNAANSVGRRNWGYIQTYGYCATTNITAGGAAGTSLRASDTPRYATASSIGVNSRSFGFAYDASSAGQSEAFIINR